MIPRSPLAAAMAILLAASAHGLALYETPTANTISIEGGGEAKTAALGSSFKDYVAGSKAAVAASERQRAVPPTPVSASTAPNPQTQSAVRPAQTQNQSKALPSAQTSPSHEVQKPNTQPSSALRPEDTAKTDTKDGRQKNNQAPSKAGNAQKTVKKGSTDGTKSDGATGAKKSTRSTKGQGSAAASNYAGLVKRKIARARRKSVNIRGKSLISLRIGDQGELVALRVARSSGSKRLDQVALAQVRTAAPFPPPPAAARRDYTIEIVGK